MKPRKRSLFERILICRSFGSFLRLSLYLLSFSIPYLSLSAITNSSAIGSALSSPSGKGSVCSWDYLFLSLDLGGVVLLVYITSVEDVILYDGSSSNIKYLEAISRISIIYRITSKEKLDWVCGFEMDHKSVKDRNPEVDLESGLPLIGDDSKQASTPSGAKQGKTLFAKISGRIVGGSVKGDDGPSLCRNESSFDEVSADLMKVTSKPLMGKDSANRAQQTPMKEKRKKASNKKAPKPPRPPQAPMLDAADHKLIREISELAMLKRARIERMKALKKMKIAKSSSPPPSSSSASSLFAMLFTVVFFVVIIYQGVANVPFAGMSSGTSSVTSFQRSPVSAGESEGGLISVEYQLNPSASDSNSPGSESPNFVQKVAGSDLPENLRRDSG
ncbi:unnamed protein product [Sphenostylis stenocarpa]|uniref:Transmembrane protein n=1 Tax=Sphenostylis stenocarpa TaxID=92480 RepID=A0AA86VZC7_9FABA|nr:unnamed protein product [Sphenostylis stenocarpa]